MASLDIVAFVSDAGVPQAGLGTVPTIRVRRVDTGALVATDQNMTEVGDGWYKYTLTDASDHALNYVHRVDADPLAASQVSALARYYYGATINNSELVRKLLDNRRELADGTSGNEVIYDDDSTTVIRSYDVVDETDATIALSAGDPAKRTKGV